MLIILFQEKFKTKFKWTVSRGQIINEIWSPISWYIVKFSDRIYIGERERDTKSEKKKKKS